MQSAALLALLCVVPAALSACDSSDSGAGASSGAVEQLVLTTGPSGYRQAVDRALGVDDAASATSSDPHALAQRLARTGFDGGWSRVWSSGDAYLSIVVMQAGTAYGAQDLMQFQTAQLSSGLGVVAYPDADVPGARAFDFYATTRQGGRQVFCQGAMFSVEADVFTLNDCNSAPRSADRVLATARAQYERAASALHVPVASPQESATPS